jgi:hypothetical protein
MAIGGPHIARAVTPSRFERPRLAKQRRSGCPRRILQYTGGKTRPISGSRRGHLRHSDVLRQCRRATSAQSLAGRRTQRQFTAANPSLLGRAEKRAISTTVTGHHGPVPLREVNSQHSTHPVVLLPDRVRSRPVLASGPAAPSRIWRSARTLPRYGCCPVSGPHGARVHRPCSARAKKAREKRSLHNL